MSSSPPQKVPVKHDHNSSNSDDLTAAKRAALAHWATALKDKSTSPPASVAQTPQIFKHSWQGHLHSMSRPIATAWTVGPIPPAQVQSLLAGYSPHDMEDKWLIYSSGLAKDAGPGEAAVHVCRSWTGFETFVFTLQVKDNGEGLITQLAYETDEERCSGMDEQEAKVRVADVCQWYLKVPLGS
jgi:hypothetical protein